MNIKQTLIYFLYNYIHLLTATSHHKSLRVIGGRDAPPDESYVLKIDLRAEMENEVVKYFHVCTCTVFKPTWSLTAGHCIDVLEEAKPLSPVVRGVIRYNISSEHKFSFSNILSTFKQPNYRMTRAKLENDIGLLLTETIFVSKFAKLSSVDYFTLYGSEVMSLGFGDTIGSNGSFGDALSVDKPLQGLDAVIIRCNSNTFTPAFCLGGICGIWPSSERGDSGGPVLHVSGVIGVCTGRDIKITKYHNKKGLKLKYKMRREAIGVFTPVSVYVDWISNLVNSISL